MGFSLSLGIKSDPIEYRYDYTWLFHFLNDLDIRYVQLGSFFEMYWLEDGFFHELRENAERKNIRIKSAFTAHRELGGFVTGNPYLEKVTRTCYERYLEIGGILGLDYLGSNLGTVYLDKMETKAAGLKCYIKHMKELLMQAKEQGIKAMTVEPMSCSTEPPSYPDELLSLMKTFDDYHTQHPDSTIPLRLCGDISHGVANREGKVLHGNLELFELEIPYMAEFHFKNTDAIFNSTFGFSDEENARGIIDLHEVKTLIETNTERWPVDDVVGYLELTHLKFGREYSDYKLEKILSDSLMALKEVFR
ncbi:hypothetical protein CSA56_04275 [candidate division KSB3 bacterium]|uniref:Xylose isomerase-like TIM barrel domain-containing protein n=1 Tax=candidate division KSB3 bacterium TaxID=2044937 RepID=A0A2G6KK31_9BACT|nr:MAG: hypothetical protein CSA56_04275 [candidate division KSB3 bacterium]